MREIDIKNTELVYDYTALVARPKTDKIVIHHTGNPKDDDLSASQINQSHQSKGWVCIGYHYVVRKNGTIEMGRPHWMTGAHAYGDNNHTIGIHVSGNFELAEPTEAQIEGVAMLLGKVCADYCLPIDPQHVVGHGDLKGETACPGKALHKMLAIIRGKAIWYQLN